MAVIVRLVRGAEIRYIEWSTTVDAPVTRGMTREALEHHYRVRYGAVGMLELPGRLARADEYGTSSFADTLDDLLAVNRAGPRESHITLDQIWELYCT